MSAPPKDLNADEEINFQNIYFLGGGLVSKLFFFGGP